MDNNPGVCVVYETKIGIGLRCGTVCRAFERTKHMPRNMVNR
jgi:hypothetical protein